MQHSHTFDLSKLGINAWKLVKPESLVMSSYKFVLISEEIKEDNKELLASKLSMPSEKILTFANVEEFKKTVKSGDSFCIVQVLTKEAGEKDIFDYSQFEDVIVGFYLYTYDWNFVKDVTAIEHFKNNFVALKRGFINSYPEELSRGSIEEVEEVVQDELPFSFVILADEEVLPEEIQEFEEVLRPIGSTAPTQYLTNPNAIVYPELGKLCVINFSSYSFVTEGKEEKVFCYLHLKDILELLDQIDGKKARIFINQALNLYAEGEDECEELIDPEIAKIVYSSAEAIKQNSYEVKSPQILATLASQATLANPVNQTISQNMANQKMESMVAVNSNTQEISAQAQQKQQGAQQEYTNKVNYQNQQVENNYTNNKAMPNNTNSINTNNRGKLGYRQFNTLQSQAALRSGKDIGFVFLAMPVQNQKEQGVINQYLQGLGIENSIFLQSYEELRNFIQSQPSFIINVITFLDGNPQDYGVYNFGFALAVDNWQQLLEGEVQSLVFNLNLASKAGYKNSYLNLQLR